MKRLTKLRTELKDKGQSILSMFKRRVASKDENPISLPVGAITYLLSNMQPSSPSGVEHILEGVSAGKFFETPPTLCILRFIFDDFNVPS